MQPIITSTRLIPRRFDTADVDALLWLTTDESVAAAAAEIGRSEAQVRSYIETHGRTLHSTGISCSTWQ